MISYIKRSLVLVLGLCYLSTSYSAPSCVELFDTTLGVKTKKPDMLPKAGLDLQLVEGYDSPNITALKSYNSVIAKDRRLKTITGLDSSIRNLLSDESLSSFHLILSQVLDGAKLKIKTKNTKEENLNTIATTLEAKLTEMMSPSEAKRRASLIKSGEITSKKLMEALGYMTQKQSVDALVGKNGINNISRASLVGRYLSEAKALGINVNTLVGRFKQGPEYAPARGGEKLYIAVDQYTVGIANKIFGNNPNLLAHNHTSGQGTLYMHYMGQSVSYATYRGESQMARQTGTIIPLIALSSIEASNTNNYFSLGTLENKYAKYPWGFKKQNGEERENYCRTGGYTSCTHWIGEAPIGQSFVTKYSFPGLFDQHSSRTDYTTQSGEAGSYLRTSKVGTYNVFVSNSGVEEIGYSKRTHRLARIVWTEKAGRQQLWQMVGDADASALTKAEWANPGWVVYSFMTKTTQDRVPVVLLVVEDASQPLTQETLDSFTRNISQY